jgi:hypothetical protein
VVQVSSFEAAASVVHTNSRLGWQFVQRTMDSGVCKQRGGRGGGRGGQMGCPVQRHPAGQSDGIYRQGMSLVDGGS